VNLWTAKNNRVDGMEVTSCQRCDRAGSYRRDGLLARIGRKCGRLLPADGVDRPFTDWSTHTDRQDFSRPCGAPFTDLATSPA
jgi:hypothetical protein